MAQQTHIIDSDVPVRVTVEPDEASNRSANPAPADGQPWFRLFRSLVHSGVWADLTPASAKVLIVLSECVNDARRGESGRWFAWPSVATICERSGCQRRAVQKALSDLETRGLISRCRRRTARRGDFSNEYELYPPKGTDDAPAGEGAHGDAQGGASGEAHGGASAGAPEPAARRARGPRGGVRPAGAAGCAQQSRTGHETDQTSAGAADALRAAGVEEPMLGKLLAGHEASELLLRVEDWKLRKGLGQRLGPAWLIASVRDGYDLHERTAAKRAAEAKREAAAERRGRLAEARRAEADEAGRLDAAAAELLASMSVDELRHWKREVLADVPSLAGRLADADPAEDGPLRRLIQGRLVRLVGDPD